LDGKQVHDPDISCFRLSGHSNTMSNEYDHVWLDTVVILVYLHPISLQNKHLSLGTSLPFQICLEPSHSRTWWGSSDPYHQMRYGFGNARSTSVGLNRSSKGFCLSCIGDNMHDLNLERCVALPLSMQSGSVSNGSSFGPSRFYRSGWQRPYPIKNLRVFKRTITFRPQISIKEFSVWYVKYVFLHGASFGCLRFLISSNLSKQ